MPNIYTYPNAKDAVLNACKDLMNTFKQYSLQPILFLSSSGSALEILRSLEAPKNLDLTIGVLDERLSTDESINNFAQLTKTKFYESCVSQKYRVFDTRVIESHTLDELKFVMQSNIQDWLSQNPDGAVIITQGMGIDGHTAGVFQDKNCQKFNQEFNSVEKLFIGYDATIQKTTYPLRVSVSLAFLKYFVTHSVCLVLGNDKKNALEKSLEPKVPLNEFPFRIVRDMKSVSIYTDIDIDH